MGQKLHTIRAASLDEAFSRMRKELGQEAVVLRTTEVKEGGLFGFFSRRRIELTASVDDGLAPRKRTAAERKYAAQVQQSAPPSIGAAPVGSDEAIAQSVAYFQQVASSAKRSAPKPAQAPAPAARAAMPDGVVPFRPPKRSETETNLRKELQEMREMMQVLVAEKPDSGVPPAYAPFYQSLLRAGVSRKVAASLMASLLRNADPEALKDPRNFRARVTNDLHRRIRVTGGIELRRGVCRRVALMGPTGVGKTTCIAKLAARFAVRERARVALITADTYRVAAPEQLRVYADIIQLPLFIANDAEEMTQALRQTADYDLVLIDTAGGSPYNDDHMRDLERMLEAIRPHETLLAVAANTPPEDLDAIVHRFSRLEPTSLTFTKLDETRRYGCVFSQAIQSDLPLSYFSVGQDVPDDLQVARPDRLAALMMKPNAQPNPQKAGNQD